MAARTALLRHSLDGDRPAPRLVGLFRSLSHRTLPGLFKRYHPERYYMRGPGPRWHEKHGQAQAADGRNG